MLPGNTYMVFIIGMIITIIIVTTATVMTLALTSGDSFSKRVEYITCCYYLCSVRLFSFFLYEHIRSNWFIFDMIYSHNRLLSPYFFILVIPVDVWC
jgi:hypothetical protein